MVEYIVFAGILLAGLLAFVLYKPGQPVLDSISAERNRCESHIERRLYDALVSNGYVVRTQVPCGRYSIDLAIPSFKLAIECDGKAYHSSPEQKAHDKRKNAFLRKNGWRVLRFSGRQINRELSNVLYRIKKEANN
ncbi:endonuclease domain-containing protein [Cytobacillus pseudoceanisediminis]|uniref:endonuclease domain-containing protein n=1 Tax=Cytobacillus pseudoceanisediminis TaxID=3051614 RepID=UPI003654EEAC